MFILSVQEKVPSEVWFSFRFFFKTSFLIETWTSVRKRVKEIPICCAKPKSIESSNTLQAEHKKLRSLDGEGEVLPSDGLWCSLMSSAQVSGVTV